MTPDRRPPSSRLLIASFLLFLSVAASIGYLSVARFDLREDAGPDVVRYVEIYRGIDLEEIPPPFRYRLLTPLLARGFPSLPAGLLDPGAGREKPIQFRFAAVNLIALAVAALFLFLLMDALAFEPLESLLGGLLFLGSFYPLTRATLPVVEAWTYAFLAGCFFALITRRHLLLFLLFFLGLFNKEAILLVVPAALLLHQPRATRVAQLAVMAPSLVTYFVLRVIVLPPDGPVYSLASTQQYLYDVFVSGVRLPGALTRGAMTFGVLWLLAAYGWTRLRSDRNHPLVRWSPLIPILLVIPFLLALTVGPVWFLGFPVVIPLSVLGLRAIRQEARLSPERPAQAAGGG